MAIDPLDDEEPLEIEGEDGEEDETEAEADEADPLSDEDYQGILKAAIADAIDYVDSDLAPDRENALKYYRGEPLGNEEDGRSSIVMTELRDIIQAMMPSLLRVFCSTERYVEFLPKGQEDIMVAEQATDFVQHILMVENDGFTVLHDAMKDALTCKTGIMRWRVEDRTEVTEHSYSGLDDDQVMLLLNDANLELVKSEQVFGSEEMPVTNLTVRRRTQSKRFLVEAIPPEEFIVARTARNLDTAFYVGHRKIVTVSDLVQMGYDREEVIENAGSDDGFTFNSEVQARVPSINELMSDSDNNADPSSKKIYYVESFIRVDKDGDGITELRRVCTIGNSPYILHDEVVDEVPFAILTPDPQPHAVIGYGIFDQVKDLQQIKTAMVRGVLDSLSQSINPRTVAVEGQVNFDDLLNNEVGAVIRARQPGMVQTLDTPFVGMQAMPIIDYMDQVRAGRTGMTKASQGLDPDVLQSTTKAAVAATVAAAEQRIEMIARIFAETGMKRLYRGLLRAVVRHQDKARTVRLRNEWVAVDPRYWDAEMDVIVNVGLGTGNAQERSQLLLNVAQKQEQVLMQMGPANPLCGLSEYRNTLVKILEINNIRDGSRYFKPVDPNWKPPAPQGANDPSQALIAAQMKADTEKLKLETWKAKQQDDRERDKLDADVMLRAAEMGLKYGTQVDTTTIQALIDRNRDAAAQAAAQAAMPMQPQPQPPQPGMPPAPTETIQ
jgi:hypothetical protein